MKRILVGLMALSLLMFTFVPFVTATDGVQLPADIGFNGKVQGDCLMYYGELEMYDPEGPGPIWYGNASGKFEMEGSAVATSCEEMNNDIMWIYGLAYLTDPGGVQALGSLKVKWSEGDVKHELDVTIFSKSTSEGIFQPDECKFIAGIPSEAQPGTPGWDEAPLLSFMGTYKVGSDTQYLVGSATVWVSGGEISPIEGIEITVVHLWTGDLQYGMMWLDTPLEIDLPGIGEVTLPAVKKMKRDVEFL